MYKIEDDTVKLEVEDNLAGGIWIAFAALRVSLNNLRDEGILTEELATQVGFRTLETINEVMKKIDP